MRKGLMTP
jgi:hypothetical protein